MKRTAIFVKVFTLLIIAFTPCSGLSHEAHSMNGGKGFDGVVGLDAVSSGTMIDLLMVTATGKNLKLEHIRSSDGGGSFSKAHLIKVPGMKVFRPHRGADPRLVSRGDELLVVWTSPGTSAWGDGPFQAARSVDGGKSWKTATSPVDDHSTLGHGFLALTLDPAGTVHAVWLDSRDGAQGLRYSQSTDLGRTWTKNVTLKSKTCECCWNALYANGNVVDVLYREKEPRDMALQESRDAGKTWIRRSTVGAFGWDFKGCPHEGGALAWSESGSRLFATVWTGKEGKLGPHLLVSNDSGKSWDDPKAVASSSAEHVDLKASGKTLTLAWDDRGNEHRVIALSHSADEGKSWSPPQIVSSKDATASHPRFVAVGNGGIVFWTEQKEGLPVVWKSLKF